MNIVCYALSYVQLENLPVRRHGSRGWSHEAGAGSCAAERPEAQQCLQACRCSPGLSVAERMMRPAGARPAGARCELTNAVRIGDLESFRSIAEKYAYASVFFKDKTHNCRLRHNVIRTGLRNTSISYSRISLVDVASKLHVDANMTVADAESIVAKAIRDGGIDHANGWMQSRETGDIYSTQEPRSSLLNKF